MLDFSCFTFPGDDPGGVPDLSVYGEGYESLKVVRHGTTYFEPGMTIGLKNAPKQVVWFTAGGLVPNHNHAVALWQARENLPKDWRRAGYIIFPGTVIADALRQPFMPLLHFHPRQEDGWLLSLTSSSQRHDAEFNRVIFQV